MEAQDNKFLSNLVVGDEEVFCMDGTVSTHNVRCYTPKRNPPAGFKFKRNNSRDKLHVLIRLCGIGQISGPYF